MDGKVSFSMSMSLDGSSLRIPLGLMGHTPNLQTRCIPNR